MSSAILRIQHDLNDINPDDHNENDFYAELQNGNPLVVEAYITGPKSTPYENDIFEVEIQFSENYPFASPTIPFMAGTNHAVALAIQICITNFLRKQWIPVYTIKDMLNLVLKIILNGLEQMPIAYEMAHLYIQ